MISFTISEDTVEEEIREFRALFNPDSGASSIYREC